MPMMQPFSSTLHSRKWTPLTSSLSFFTDASGLITNFQKTHYYPIQCNTMDLNFLASASRSVSAFPCKHLCLPLHLKKHNSGTFQALVQKVANRLPHWKWGFFSYPGREVLVESVLSAIPTHYLTIFKMPKEIILRIDKFRRSFLWRGTCLENVRGGGIA
jgi:hypothetical protein